jgi:glucans biosynthesis protein
MSAHQRNTASMLSSLRCGAKTRSGGSCRSPAVSGKKRCRMHGGAQGSGAPLGNQNALKHGRYTRTAKAERRRAQELLRQTRKTLADVSCSEPNAQLAFVGPSPQKRA